MTMINLRSILQMKPYENKDINPSTPELKASANESTKAAMTQILGSSSNSVATEIALGNHETLPLLEKKATHTSIFEEKKHLKSLILEKLEILKDIIPKLGENENRIKEKVEDVGKRLEQKLEEELPNLEELKVLEKSVTKLKLQIPAKYWTHDSSDQQKNQQSNLEHGGITDPKLLEKMPGLQNKWFHQSSFCKTIQLRYYKDLTPELKHCLLCFSVFPENAIISRRVMVYWWIADCFINPGEDYLQGGRTPEDYANDIFKKLMENDFIEPVSESYRRYIAFCKMKPMVRAALVMIAEKVSLFDFDQFGDPKDFGKFGEIESPEDIHTSHPLDDPREFFYFFDEKGRQIDENGTIEFIDKGNKVQFFPLPDSSQPVTHNGKQIDKHYFYKKKEIIVSSSNVCLMGRGLSNGISWEKLHILLNVSDKNLWFKQEWFKRMKNVNILFLGRWHNSLEHYIEADNEFDFEASLGHMKHLRFFSLQGVSNISKLPNSISELENLLILDLRACEHLVSIPHTIGSLKCLTHLDMSDCLRLVEIPREISSLESLEVLKGFIVLASSRRDVCTLEDLRKLWKLRKLSMHTYMEDFPEESHLDDFENMNMLRKLTIIWFPGTKKKPKNDVSTKKKQKPVSYAIKLLTKKSWLQGSMTRMNSFSRLALSVRLEKLDLRGFPNNVTPDWLRPASLKGLKKLYIRSGPLSDLGRYEDILEHHDLQTPFMETWNVEILRLRYLDELKMEWKELQNLFPRLNFLEKVKCPGLTLFPCNEHGVWAKKLSTTT